MNLKPKVFVSASAIGIYGDRGDELLNESSSNGEGFLSQVCRVWEDEINNAKALGVTRIVGVTSHIDSPLRQLSELVLDMGGEIDEACPLNLAPSSSIAAMLAISDAIALTLMELKEFTPADYGKRHHKGYLGSITRNQHQYDPA